MVCYTLGDGSVTDRDGNQSVAYVNANSNGVNLNWNRLDSRWNQNCRFLAVSNLLLFSPPLLTRGSFV